MRWIISFVKRALGNLQIRILLIILVSLFTPVIFSINNYLKHAEQITIDNTSSLVMYNLEQIGDKIQNICLNMITLSNVILNDDLIVENMAAESDEGFQKSGFYIKNPLYNKTEELLRITKIENEINSLKSKVFFNQDIDVLIVGSDGNIYSSLDPSLEYMLFKQITDFLSQNWFQTVRSGERAALWNVPYKYDLAGWEDNRYISIVKPIKSKKALHNTAGILMINFSEKSLDQTIGNTINGYISIINETNQILFSSDKTMETEILSSDDIMSRNLYYGSGSFFTSLNGKKFLVSFNSIERFGLCAISLIPYKDVINEINSLKFKINSINFIIFGSFLLIGMVLVMNTIDPIKQLLKRMKKMKVGAYSVDVAGYENLDDVNGLVHSFDKMLDRVEELVNIVVEEQKVENDLRYEALRAQINPHFLFNTLSTIKWSAKMSGADNVSSMISALGRLLEVSINKDEEEITFREELELVRCYIYIQNARYNDKFEFVITVEDEKIYDYKVFKFILQPIVENCIIHGFEDKEEDCRIEVRAHVDDEKLMIEVIDNGSGMDENKSRQLLIAGSSKRRKFNGIGLNNVHERIKLKYGEAYGLDIKSAEKAGTTVSILFPIIQAVSKENIDD